MSSVTRRINPNWVTLARIGLIPVFVAALLTRGVQHAPGTHHHAWATWVAFALFAFAASSDGLDGYLARKHRSVTTLGIFLDPLADKLLITAALVTLVQLREIQAWIVVLIISREFAVTGLRLITAGQGEVMSASWLGKAKTVSQIALVLVLIPHEAPPGVRIGMQVAAAVLTLWSGADYFWKARHLLREAQRVDDLTSRS